LHNSQASMATSPFEPASDTIVFHPTRCQSLDAAEPSKGSNKHLIFGVAL